MSYVETNRPAVRSPHEHACFEYWDSKRDDSINLQPGDDGLFHSHYSVVDFDRTVLNAPSEMREERILKELHRLENRQVELFIDTLGPVGRNDRVMDNGCGRGGTSFVLHDRYGCLVDGIDFSPYRIEFARKVAVDRGCAERVMFHLGNMVETGFPDRHFQFVVNNEAAEHLESMDELCCEVARVLRPGGRFAAATWVANDSTTQRSDEPARINKNYRTRIHTRASYLKAMVAHDLIPIHVQDLTAEAIPYWELRSESVHRTGIESAFLTVFRQRIMNYLFIVSEYQPAG